jgi:hypothetical protein
MKLIKTIFSTAVFFGIALGIQPMVASAAPQLTIQSEQAAHPRITDAIHKLEQALGELQAAPDDFGGNKAAAMADMRTAIHSLKKALYFRLHLDDAAIDNAH